MDRPNPEKIPGWMAPDCLDWLAKQGAAATKIVEVGCWKGRATAALLSRSEARLWAVDTWQGTMVDQEQDKYFNDKEYAYQDFRTNLKYYFDRQQIVPLQMTSNQGGSTIAITQGHRSMDFIFLDGDHRYEAVLDDIQNYKTLVRPGGTLAGHDYATERWTGVKKAVDKVFKIHAKRGPGSIWYVRL